MSYYVYDGSGLSAVCSSVLSLYLLALIFYDIFYSKYSHQNISVISR